MSEAVPEISPVKKDRKKYLDLLLLADPSEEMVDRYLEAGDLFVMFLGDTPVCEAVVCGLGGGACELKNLATAEPFQKRGYAGRMISFLCDFYRPRCRRMLVGTSEGNFRFYRNCGLRFSHVVKNFFPDQYPGPVIDNGEVLTDMTYFEKELRAE